MISIQLCSGPSSKSFRCVGSGTLELLFSDHSAVSQALNQALVTELDITEANASVPTAEVQTMEPTLSPISVPAAIKASSKAPWAWIEPGHTGPSPRASRRLSLQVSRYSLVKYQVSFFSYFYA